MTRFFRRKRGDTRINTGDVDGSEDDFNEYKTLANKEGNALEVQRAHHCLGRVYLYKAEDSDVYRVKAEKHFKLAITKIPDESQCDSKTRADMKYGALKNLINNYIGWGRLDMAEKCCHETLEVTRQFPKDDKKVEILNLNSEIKLKQNKANQAFEVNKNALNLLESSHKFEDKKELQCDSLKLKAKILICLRHFSEARNLLKKHQRSFKSDEYSKCLLEIAEKLRTADKVLKKGTVASETASKICEKMGDILANSDEFLVEAKPLSNEFYKKALECDEIGKKRSSGLYESIAMNFDDLGDYTSAKKYLKKELEINSDSSEKSLSLILKMAKLSDKNCEPSSTVSKYLDQAKTLAQRLQNPVFEGKVLQAERDHFERNLEDDKANEAGRKLAKFLAEHSLSKDCLDSDDSEDDLDESVDLDEWSVSESEVEEEEGPRGRKKFKTRKNNLGETDLHLNCQSEGNLDKIRTLIKMGHPVNEPDYSDFTALHEAANHGFLSYVKELREAGANLNARSKDGITPMITASGNGRFDVVEYLLNAGAKVHFQDKWGWTAKCYLEIAVQKRDEDSQEQWYELGKRLVDRMREMLKGEDLLLQKQPKSFAFKDEGEDAEPFSIIKGEFFCNFP